MAQWWELAIPAGITLIGTLSAGLLGAGYQRRSSERLLRMKAEEDAKVRREQADEAAHTRRLEVVKEKQAQSFKERFEAYRDFITAPRAIERLEQVADSRRRQVDKDVGLVAEPEKRMRSLNNLIETLSELDAVRHQLVGAYDRIMFLGSPRLVAIAQVLSRARLEHAGKRAIDSLEVAFIHAANRDLNVAVREDVGSEPSSADMILHLYDNYGTDTLRAGPSSDVVQESSRDDPG
jgi:hypothetical protein